LPRERRSVKVKNKKKSETKKYWSFNQNFREKQKKSFGQKFLFGGRRKQKSSNNPD
jgi:hypothetical protein